MKIEKSLAKKVIKDTNEIVDYTPASGKDIIVYLFSANVPHIVELSVQLIWDQGGAGEEILWTLSPDNQSLPNHLEFTRSGDGTKKMSLCLSNESSTTDYFMSGWFKADIK